MSEITGEKLEKNTKFKAGDEWTGNANGRPKGSISVIGKIKQKFEQNPEYFEEWINEFLEDGATRKAIMEQIDGKPARPIDLIGDITINVVKYD